MFREIVHNKQVVQQLEDLDLNVVENIEELGKASSNEDIVIIRAHGVSKDVYQKIEELQYKCVDLTCPNVLNIHKIAKKIFRRRLLYYTNRSKIIQKYWVHMVGVKENVV